MQFPEWLMNFLGIMLGAYAAFWIAKWQLSREAEKETRNSQQAGFVALKRIEWELVFNAAQVSRLRETLARSDESRVELWRCGIVTIDFVTRVAYDDFLRTGLQKGLSHGVQDSLFTAYLQLHYLSYQVKQAAAAHEFYQGYEVSDKSANQYLREVKINTSKVDDFVWRAIKEIRDAYPKEGAPFEFSGLTLSFDE
jgi:hypothetical protein